MTNKPNSLEEKRKRLKWTKRLLFLVLGIKLLTLSFGAKSASTHVFVSSSMPDSAIQQYYEEIKSDPESRLVLRGLVKGSMMETKKYIERLKVVMDIDPPVFDEFGIKAVPTILIQAGENLYYSHTGHVPISYVHEKISEKEEA